MKIAISDIITKFNDINYIQNCLSFKKNSMFDPCIGIKRNRWAGGLRPLGSKTLLFFLDLMFVNRSSRFSSERLNSSMLQILNSFAWKRLNFWLQKKLLFCDFLLNIWTEIRKHILTKNSFTANKINSIRLIT